MVAGTPAPFTVVGVIDGKFECGYLVTVTLGSETLKGVLYQTPKNAADQVIPNHSTSKTMANLPTTTGVQRRRRRKKCEMRKRDPAHPKPNRSGYNFFFAEQHARLKPLYPGKDRDISRIIGDLWNKLNEAGKAVYQEKAVKDKERYRIEMDDYKEMLKTGQVISNVLPNKQQPLEIDINMIDADAKIEAEGGGSPQTPQTELSSGYGDRSKLDNITADRDNVMVKAHGVEIKAQNIGMVSLVDKKTLEVHNGVVNKGQEGIELMETNDHMESQKKSAPSEGKESEEPEQRETAANEVSTEEKLLSREDTTKRELDLLNGRYLVN
ncbi:hypothetical protein AgCh_018034 [Apium graveolens]